MVDSSDRAFHVAVGKQQEQVVLTADVLIKIAASLPVQAIPTLSAVCQGFWDACRDDSVWKERCKAHIPPYEFRTAVEQRILGGWRALYKHRYSILERLPRRGMPSQEARTGDLLEVESGVRCLAVSGSLTVAGLSNGKLVIYRTVFCGAGHQEEDSLTQPHKVATCSAHSTWVYSVCCESNFTHADGSGSALVASCSRDQTVRVWVGPGSRRDTGWEGKDEEDWKELFVLEGHEDWVAHVKMSNCRKRLLSSGNDGRIVLWCLHQGVAMRTFKFGPEDSGLWWMELHDTKSSTVVVATGAGNVIVLNYDTGRWKVGSVSSLVRENTSSPSTTDPCFFSCARQGTVLAAVNGVVAAAQEPRLNDNPRDSAGNPINTVMTSQRDLKWVMESEVVETWMVRALRKRRLGIMLTSAQGMHRFPELPRRAPGSSLVWFSVDTGELVSGAIALPTHKRCMSMQSKLSHFVMHSVDPSFSGTDELQDADASQESGHCASTAVFRRMMPRDAPDRLADIMQRMDELCKGRPVMSAKIFGQVWSMELDEERGQLWLGGTDALTDRGLLCVMGL